MTAGTPYNRHWVIMLADGVILMDYGDQFYQDLITGAFLHAANLAGSHTILDEELNWLKRAGHIADFDADNIYISGLPQRPVETLD